jgi:peptide/nickel transport system permease protein
VRELGRFLRSSPLGAASALLLLVACLLALFADLIAPYDPLAASYGQTRQAPSLQHLLGTDHLGRDVLSRMLYGTRVTMFVAVSSVLIGDAIGFAWGVASGYAGRRFDMISQRFVEVVPGSARIVRSVVLSVKELAFVEAARCIGASPTGVAFRHIAPQCVAPMLVVASINLGTAIFAESALSFLGVGVPPPTPTWGNMVGGVLAEAFRPPWWIVVFPGLAITLTILSCNLLGDALRDFLDPKLRRRVG